MAADNKWIINQADNVAELLLYIDGVLVTTYAFDDGDFTLTALADAVEISPDALKDNIARIYAWVQQIEMYLDVSPNSYPNMSIEFECDDDEVKLKMNTTGGIVINATWARGAATVTFQPRDQQTMNMREFMYFAFALTTLMNEVA